MLSETREFEFALHELAHAMGGPLVADLLGFKPGNLNRMVNPHDHGAHFRARDLVPLMRAARRLMPAAQALAPLHALARALDQVVYPIPTAQAPDVLLGLSQSARHWGDLGQSAIVAVDPAGEAGRLVSRAEFRAVEQAGHGLIASAAGVMHAVRGLRSPGA